MSCIKRRVSEIRGQARPLLVYDTWRAPVKSVYEASEGYRLCPRLYNSAELISKEMKSFETGTIICVTVSPSMSFLQVLANVT